MAGSNSRRSSPLRRPDTRMPVTPSGMPGSTSIIETPSEGSGEGGQQFVEGDGQVAGAHAGGVVDGVRDRGGGADYADLSDSLAAHGVDVRVVFVQPVGLDVRRVGAAGDVVVGEVVV